MFSCILPSPKTTFNTHYCWKSLTPLMWALLHGAYPVFEEHVDPAVAVHCIVAAMPFPFPSCFLSLCCPLWVAAFEGRSFHRKSQVQTDRTQRGMWTIVGDPCSRREDRGNVKTQCRAIMYPGPADSITHTDLKGWAVLIAAGGRGCGPIISTAQTQMRSGEESTTLRLRNILYTNRIRETYDYQPYLLSSESSSMKPESQRGQV